MEDSLNISQYIKTDMQKKRVAIIKYDMSHQGGSERVAANLANELSCAYDITLISMQISGDTLPFSVNEKVKHAVLFKGHHRLSALYLSLATTSHKLISEMKFDAIICIGFETALFPALLKKRNRGKVIFSEQNIMGNVFLKTKKVAFLRSFAVKHSDVTVVLSGDDSTAYKNAYPKYADKIFIIYNWIDEKLYSGPVDDYNENSKTIVTVGRISPVKNYEDLVKVAKKVFSVKRDWHWDIYGYGEPEYGKFVRKLIEENGLSDYITLKGHIKNIYEFYKDYSLLVHTAKAEGFGLVLIEAQTRGLPIVAFEGIGGMKEIVIDGANGYLAKNGDVEEMADQILHLIDSLELRKSFSQHSRDGLYKFERQKIVAQWIDLIERQ